MRHFAICFFALACWAASLGAQTLAAPMAGFVLDGNGQLTAIHGVFGNLLPGKALTQGISGPFYGGAFTASGGVVKTLSQVLLLDAAGAVRSVRGTPTGEASFSFASDGSLAWMYFAVDSSLRSANSNTVWHGASFGDSIVNLGAAGSVVLPVLARSGDQLWAEQVNAATGTILAQLPISGTAPAVWFENGWLVTSGHGLRWFASGSTTPVEIPFSEDVQTLQVAGAHAVAVNGRWLMNAQWQPMEIPIWPRTVRHRLATE